MPPAGSRTGADLREVAELAGLAVGRESAETVRRLLGLVNRMRGGERPLPGDEVLIQALRHRYGRELERLERRGAHASGVGA
ncbi:MAG: hypothetical protein RIB67_03635 [Miltoncostaeaceae bacterium]